MKKTLNFTAILLISALILLLVSCGDDDSASTRQEAAQPAAQAAADPAATDAGPFALRDALDNEAANVSLEQLLAAIDALDENNFFLVISHADGFMQTMIANEKYHTEYSDASGYFHAAEYLSKKELTRLFTLYYQGDEAWHDLVEWEEQ